MKNFMLTGVLSCLVMSSVSCAGIKTRKQLKFEGINVERNNANVSSARTPAPVEVRKEVVVVKEAPAQESTTVVQAAPVKPADPVSQRIEMAAEIRNLKGELQDIKDTKALEQQTNAQWRLEQDQKMQKLEAKLKIYEQSIAALEEEVVHLKALKTPAKKVAKKGIFERAQGHMDDKNWKKAILEFENYRKKYPRGRRISLATYYIGVCFQELGLKDEAKVFYQETVDKYPKTTAFNKASYRLKQLK